MGVYARVFGVLGMVILAMLAGFWIGSITAPRERWEAGDSPADPSLVRTPETEGSGAETAAREVPLFFYANTRIGSSLRVVASEIAMAADAGIHRHILAVPLAWDGHWEGVDDALDLAFTADPDGRVMLDLDLNPPASWLADHPSETASTVTKGLSYPSIGSRVWLDEVLKHLGSLANHLDTTAHGPGVVGLVVSALEEGRWYRTDGYDRSEANTRGFRNWLKGRYEADDAFQEAWNTGEATLDTAEIPESLGASSSDEVFFALPAMQAYVDFLRYLSEATAGAIVEITDHVKALRGTEFEVIVPYGFSFELPGNDSGHAALSKLMASDVDGFLSPVSYVNRGSGGAGGFMGPVDSAALHGKQWYVVDDTRTGIGADPGASTVRRPMGVRLEDVLNIYRRNFSMAAIHGLGLVWCDPLGRGNLHDVGLWEAFAQLREVYEDIAGPKSGSGDGGVDLFVVVDEESRFYQREDRGMNSLLLTETRDVALQAGVSTKFVLLRDVLEGATLQDGAFQAGAVRGAASPPPAYLFLNAFRLSEEERGRIHDIMASQGSAAIWMVAPGYIDDVADVEHVSATTGMTVKAFDEPAASGSTYAFSGNWIVVEGAFGAGDSARPLFYIEDDDADVLAHFNGSERVSAGIKFLEEDWASVFVCEPVLPVELLREILEILGFRLAVKKRPVPTLDTVQIGRGLMLLHANGDGERGLDLGRTYDVTDLLDPRIGWVRKREITLSMKAGETRLFYLAPNPTENTIETDAAMAEGEGEGELVAPVSPDGGPSPWDGDRS